VSRGACRFAPVIYYSKIAIAMFTEAGYSYFVKQIPLTFLQIFWDFFLFLAICPKGREHHHLVKIVELSQTGKKFGYSNLYIKCK
jgi:hypothetical protein